MKENRVICPEKTPEGEQCWREVGHKADHLVMVEAEDRSWQQVTW